MIILSRNKNANHAIYAANTITELGIKKHLVLIDDLNSNRCQNCFNSVQSVNSIVLVTLCWKQHVHIPVHMYSF